MSVMFGYLLFGLLAEDISVFEEFSSWIAVWDSILCDSVDVDKGEHNW